uniref:Uncharacterized protein n=1 Tax=Haptolina ericina TaxID=156174 RepID=A0A7S3BQY2_9EUKA
MGHENAAAIRSTKQDPETTVVPLDSLLKNGGGDFYAVLYNGERGNANAEEDLLDDIIDSGGVGCPEHVLGRACGVIVLSLGGKNQAPPIEPEGVETEDRVDLHQATSPPAPRC